jgi:uncharacterized protein (DUF488 family)
MTRVYTAGHSNTPVQSLIDQLTAAGIKTLVDIRRYPGSRRNPQFSREALAASLNDAGIEYRHFEALGGRRSPASDSANGALTNEQFRGYADYMGTAEFEQAIEALLLLAEEKPTAVMCAEAVPWRCHRSLLADYLTGRGHEVVHLIGGKQTPHHLTAVARIDDGRVSYPALL